jgi:DNA-binding sugar fermentation-stimulating protein
VHIGRVNTLQRLRFACDVGADTVDGTAFSMFPDTYIERGVKYLQRLEQSPTLF